MKFSKINFNIGFNGCHVCLPCVSMYIHIFAMPVQGTLTPRKTHPHNPPSIGVKGVQKKAHSHVFTTGEIGSSSHPYVRPEPKTKHLGNLCFPQILARWTLLESDLKVIQVLSSIKPLSYFKLDNLEPVIHEKPTQKRHSRMFEDSDSSAISSMPKKPATCVLSPDSLGVFLDVYDITQCRHHHGVLYGADLWWGGNIVARQSLLFTILRTKL